MFIARETELQLLNDLYSSSKFEFLVLYGRRRVGKTSLLQEFSKDKKTFFFSAQEKNDSLNLSDFSKAVQQYFDGNYFINHASKLRYIRYRPRILFIKEWHTVIFVIGNG